jgi:predicted DNA-binding transcriptional regulator AlpA
MRVDRNPVQPAMDPLSAIISAAVTESIRPLIQKIENLEKRLAANPEPVAAAAPDGLLSIEDVTRMLGISKPTLWRLRKKPHLLKPKQISPGRVMYDRAAVQEYMAKK